MEPGLDPCCIHAEATRGGLGKGWVRTQTFCGQMTVRGNQLAAGTEERKKVKPASGFQLVCWETETCHWKTIVFPRLKQALLGAYRSPGKSYEPTSFI